MPSPFPTLLSETDATKICLSFMTARGADGATEDEVRQILSWTETVLRQYTLLKLTLKGDVVIDINEDDDDIVFHETTEHIGTDAKDVLQRELAQLGEQDGWSPRNKDKTCENTVVSLPVVAETT